MYKIGFIGDLHISDRVTGRHKDYYGVCIEILDKIQEAIVSEQLTHLILCGDIFGTHEHTLKTMEARAHIFERFALWNTYLNGNLYSIRGNHDSGAKTTDFDVLAAAQLIKVPNAEGYMNLDIGGYRVHMLDYGHDNAEIQLADDRSNIAVMHSYLSIPGKIDLMNIKQVVNLSSLVNLKGCDLVIGGHYHSPSKYQQTMIEDKPISLVYLGCPTRPSASENYTETYMLVATSEEDGGNYSLRESMVSFKLCPLEELLKPVKEKDIDVEESISRTKMVEAVLDDLANYQIGGSGAYRTRLESMRNVDSDAVDLCLKYIDEVF